MNEPTSFVQGEHDTWSYDPVVDIITILDTTGRVVKHGWSVGGFLQQSSTASVEKMIDRIKMLGETQEVPCGPVTAVELFLAGVLTLNHLERSDIVSRNQINCSEVKIGQYERKLLIMSAGRVLKYLQYRRKK